MLFRSYISEQVDFSEGYRGFIFNLYDMDNGNNDGRAMDLSDVTSNVDRIEKADSSSVYDVKLQLSEEQLSNISNINAFIVVDTKKIGWRKKQDTQEDNDTYMVVYFGRNVPIDEDGSAHLYYANKAIYAKDALTEEVTETPLLMLEDNVQADEKRYKIGRAHV